MNTKLNTKMWRRLFSPSVVTLLIGFGVLVWGSPSIQAQTTSTTTTTAPATTVDSSVTIKASGTVNDPAGAITVSGSVIVSARRVIDTTGLTPTVVLLDLDFSNLQGTSGSLTTLKTYVTGGNHASELRPFQASDTIIVTCPYYDNTKDGLSAKTMLITATLNFDINTGKVTGGSISIGNNVITPAAVGTTTTTAAM